MDIEANTSASAESIVERLACFGMLPPDATFFAQVASAGEALQALLAAGPSHLTELVATLQAQAERHDPHCADTIAALCAAWEGARHAGVPASAPPAAPMDDELAVLSSDAELAGLFFAEALDHLGSIEALVLQLESSPEDSRLLNDVFRPFHTIKGNAGALGVTSIQEVAHKVESLLDLARSGKFRIGRASIDVVLRAVDVLTALINDVSRRLSGETAPDRTRERHALMMTVEDLIQNGEPVAAAPQAVVADAASADANVPAPTTRRESAAQASVKVDTRKLDNLVDIVGELVIVESIIHEDPALLRAADERLTRNLAQLKRITSDLQRNAMSMRMVPIRQTFQKMSRLVRDLSRHAGKPVELVLSGEDTELDRRVVEDINDPLMHMVRNSLDHGIESPEARAAAGKTPVGRLSLSAYHQGGNIVIAIGDDGAGLDAARIKAKAMSSGVIDAATPMAESEIYQLIFRPGFSTAERVTEISGRGVGMDVVRRNVDALRGRIDIQSERGKGTTFLISLPLTLAIVEGLLLRVGAERFVLPTFAICESLKPAADQIHRVQGVARMVRVRNALLPLVHLGDVFGVPGAQTDPVEATLVVIEDGGRRVALVVDQLLGKQEVVIKALGETFAGVRGVSGGAILGDGRIGLILDAHGLVDMTRAARAA